MIGLADFAARFGGARKSGDGYVALCPAHDDKNPSLSFSEKDGRILLHCFAGCSADDILARTGLTFADLSAEPGKRDVNRPAPQYSAKVVATYDYTDEQGNVLYQVLRKEWIDEKGERQKDFPQRRPDGNGGWIWKLDDTRRVLYRSPNIVEAVALGKTIYVVEGEKDADNLVALGLEATTSPGGAGKWRPEYAETLRAADVVILPDNDGKGAAHAETAAASLKSAGCRVRMVKLPGLPHKGDVSDWLAAGHSGDELAQQVDAAPDWTPTLESTEAASDAPQGRGRPRQLHDWVSVPGLLDPPPSLIPQMAYKGRSTLMSAREKAGKSTLVGQAVAELTRGGEFLGQSLTPRVVLWYCLDEPVADCVRRFQYKGGDPHRLYICEDRPENAADLRADMEACGVGAVEAVVVDTLSELWRGKIRSENDADEVSRFLDPFIREMRRAGVAAIFTHHSPKNGREYRGSGSIGAKLDVLLTLRKPSTGKDQPENVNENDEDLATDDGRRILEGRGRGVPHFVQRLSFTGDRYELGDAPVQLRWRILWALRDGLADSANTLETALRCRRESVFDAINRDLIPAGLLRREGKRLALTGTGALVASADRPTPEPRASEAAGTGRGTGGPNSQNGVELGGNRGGTGREPVREPVNGENGATGSHAAPLVGGGGNWLGAVEVEL